MIAAPPPPPLRAPEPVGARLLAARDGAIVSLAPDGRATRLAPGVDAAWSPDGTLVVLVRSGDLELANADGTGIRALTRTPAVQESEPDWRPDGKAIAYTASIGGRRQIRLLEPASDRTRRIAPSAAEEWSPAFTADGRGLAFVSTRDGEPEIEVARADGGGAAVFRAPDPSLADRPLAYRDLAWSPAGDRLAYTADTSAGAGVYVDDGVTQTLVQPGSRPVWSPDGGRLALADPTGAVAVTPSRPIPSNTVLPGTRGAGAPLDWRRVPLGRPRWPDLVQRPPSGLVVTSAHGRYLLGFVSLVDNRGAGPLWIRATRRPGADAMDAAQLLRLAGGGVRRVPGVGELRYTVAPPHYHWHLLGFDRYELRRASDFSVVVRDRKSGFCLADHYGIAPGIPHGPPRFVGDCGQFRPRLTSVEEGSSVGYTDRYPANFHGQSLDVTHVPAGRYWLVHRVNSARLLRERSYDNDAASLLVRISRPGGGAAPPRVAVLRACRAERC